MEIPDHCPALLLLVLPFASTTTTTIRIRDPSPSPSGRDGVRACISIFRKHFQLAYDSLGNWKTPDDEHNQDESTLYISDPLEGAIYWNQQFLDCVHGGNHSHPKRAGVPGSRGIQIATETMKPGHCCVF